MKEQAKSREFPLLKNTAKGVFQDSIGDTDPYEWYDEKKIRAHHWVLSSALFFISPASPG
jgi:hypothetical protein